MSVIAKAGTAARLLWQGDRATFVRQAVHGCRRWFALRHRKTFRHKRLGFPFLCVPTLADSVTLFCDGLGEDDALELALLRRWLEPGDAVIDAGANLGLYAVVAAQKANGTGRVIAIEPSPSLAAAIRLSARQLGLKGLAVAECCAGETEGETVFFQAPDDQPTGEQSRRVPLAQQRHYRSVSVPLQTLDGLVAAHLAPATPAFIKLDLEGSEPLALRGAGRLLDLPDPPLWQIEINPGSLQRYDATALDIITHFSADRFSRWLIPHRQAGRTASPPRPLTGSESFDDALFYNLLAVPQQGRFAARADRIRSLLS